MSKIISFLWWLFIVTSLQAADQQAQNAFQQESVKNWQTVFNDPMTHNWQEKWFLDGKFAQVSNNSKYLTINTSDTKDSDNIYAVLWTKENFVGDLRIEYDFKNVNSHYKGVNIIYIQATGDEQTDHLKDISKWSHKRELGIMRDYFLNMHTYHISYAAFGNKPNIDYKDYVRARRYLPEANKGMKNTVMKGEYNDTGLFKDQQWVHVTIIKKAKELWIEFKHPKKTLLCYFENDKNPAIEYGRIGLRLMPKRVSQFKNFKVSTLSK